MSKERQKGTSFETAIVRWLNQNGFPEAHRNALAGTLDKGDVGGIPGVCVELKNCSRMDLAGWVEEARRESITAQAPIFVVGHKRRGRSDGGEQYVTMPMSVFAQLLAAYRAR